MLHFRWLIVPFRDNGRLNQRQRQFNQKLSSIRAVVERSIRLKGRWRKLIFLENIDLVLVVKIIMSACVLHNFCLLRDDFEDGYFLDDGDDGSSDDGGGGSDSGPRDGQGEQKRVQLMNLLC